MANPIPDSVKVIFGLDLSLTATGYCVCAADSPEFTILDLQTVKTSPLDGGTFTRIQKIVHGLENAGAFKPHTVFTAIEDLAFGFAGAFLILCELGGVIRYEHFRRGMDWVDISPPTGKKHATGKGNTQKNMIPMLVGQKYATELLQAGFQIKDDNQADAISMCHLGWLLYRHSHNLVIRPEVSKDTLSTLKKLSEKVVIPKKPV